jgi:glycine cleavage system aminomethyltransferase T
VELNPRESVSLSNQDHQPDVRFAFPYPIFLSLSHTVLSVSVLEDAVIYNADGTRVGVVTSGTMSPSLKKSIGMCYVDVPFNKLNTKLFAEVRGKKFPIVISKMPFVPHRYKK